jgi:hypothetical protein
VDLAVIVGAATGSMQTRFHLACDNRSLYSMALAELGQEARTIGLVLKALRMRIIPTFNDQQIVDIAITTSADSPLHIQTKSVKPEESP